MFRITRREFLKYCSVAAGALGLSSSTLMRLESAYAKSQSNGGVPVIWAAGAACTGCTMSLANTKFYTDIANLLLNTIDLEYMDTLQASVGSYIDGTPYGGSLQNVQEVYNAGGYVLVVEGAIQTNTPPGGTAGQYCDVGDIVGDGNGTFMNVTQKLAEKAVAILAVGACSSWGGIPGARGNLTGASGCVYQINASTKKITENGWLAAYKSKTINISGCPPHPDWIVGTIAYILDTNITFPPLNGFQQPIDYGYQTYQCSAGPCPWQFNNTQGRANNNNNSLISEPGYNARYPEGNSRALGVNKWAGSDVGCIGILGCKGRKTKADCSRRRWNTLEAETYGVNWCVGSRGGCHGCTQPGFPDKVGKFFTIA